MVSCKKNNEHENLTTTINRNARELSLNKYEKKIKGTYGVLTSDQRFESTDIIQLESGVLLAMLSNNFDSDTKTSVFKSYSYDNGLSWSQPEDINLPVSGYNFTATNVFRLKSRLYLIMNRVAKHKDTYEGGIPAISYSDDKGKTWSKPKLMLGGREREIVIMNSRNITITKTGRIIIPVANGQLGKEGFRVSLIYSDNHGNSWNQSPNLFGGINTRQAQFAEPSIAQLKDGRLIMLIRTSLGHIYKSYSSDDGRKWSIPTCTPLVSPWTAHSIRITKNGYLVIVYTNSVSTGDYGYPRNNLKFAVSYDNGETWKPSGKIIEIPDTPKEFLMEPNLTLVSNNNYLVTYFHQLSDGSHQIETAIFKRPEVLRDEENWEDLHWWGATGNGTMYTSNGNLCLGTSRNKAAKVRKSQIIASNYNIEFKAKMNSFLHPGYGDDYMSFQFEVANSTYKLSFKLESDGFFLKDKDGIWVRFSNPLYLRGKNEWHKWKFEVTESKASVFMDDVNMVTGFGLTTTSNETNLISYSSKSNLIMSTASFVDYTYYDPL